MDQFEILNLSPSHTDHTAKVLDLQKASEFRTHLIHLGRFDADNNVLKALRGSTARSLDRVLHLKWKWDDIYTKAKTIFQKLIRYLLQKVEIGTIIDHKAGIVLGQKTFLQ